MWACAGRHSPGREPLKPAPIPVLPTLGWKIRPLGKIKPPGKFLHFFQISKYCVSFYSNFVQKS